MQCPPPNSVAVYAERRVGPQLIGKVAEQFVEGSLRVPIQKTYELDEAPSGLHALPNEHTQGKLAIRVGWARPQSPACVFSGRADDDQELTHRQHRQLLGEREQVPVAGDEHRSLLLREREQVIVAGVLGP